MVFKEKYKDFIYKLQEFGFKFLFKFFLFIGLKYSSLFARTILTIFGPFTPPSFLALKNIKNTMPELNFFQRFSVMIGMWNNLALNIAEFAIFNNSNIENIKKYINLDEKSKENLMKIKNNPEGEILFTAHFGNWEILSKLFLMYDIDTSAIYRNMNNPYTDKIVLDFRKKDKMDMIPKGAESAIKITRSLKSGKKLLMLVDQRLSNGEEIPFLNLPAKTSISTATFALKFDYKVYSLVVYRRGYSNYFDIKIEEFDIVKDEEDDINKSIIKNTKKINQEIESWIKLKPSQWFWVHNRWKK